MSGYRNQTVEDKLQELKRQHQILEEYFSTLK